MNKAAALALLLLALWHAGLRRHGMDLPMISDEGEYAVQARVLESGGVPYRDAYNQKPPLVFFLYRLALASFGENAQAPRRLAVLFCWAAMACLFLTTPARWSLPSRLAPAAVFAVLSTEPIGDMGFAANTEVFLAALTAVSALLVLNSKAAAAGLFMGAALMTKQTAAWTALFFGAAFLAFEDKSARLKKAASYAAGCAAVPIFFILYFARRGALGDFWEQAYARNMDYASFILSFSALPEQLSWLWEAIIPAYLLGDWPVYALALLGLSATRAHARQNREMLAALWLGSALIGASTGLYFFPHYFLPAIPPLALLAGLGLHLLSQRPGLKKAAWPILLFLCLYPPAARARIYFFSPPETVAKKLLYPNPLYEAALAADYIKTHSNPQDRVYVFGSEPQIYFYSGLRSATRHIFVYPLTLFPRGPADIRAELEALEASPPRFLVYVNLRASTLIASDTGDSLRAGVRDLLGRRYRWEGTVEVNPEGQALWAPAQRGGPDWSSPALFVFEKTRRN